MKLCWTPLATPEGFVPSGASTGDAPLLISCMRMFETDFFSPWSSANSPFGPNSPRYFAAAYYWVYGILGAALSILPLSWALRFEIVNTLGLLFYLWAVWMFLRAFFPNVARSAFALFALGGGIGGLVFVCFRVLGLHLTPEYESRFLRYALYELLEGAHVPPLALAWRLYYTLPLGLFLSAMVLAGPNGNGLTRPRRYVPAGIALFLAGWINMRVGAGVSALVMLHALLCIPESKIRLRSVFALILPSAAGVIVGLGMQRMNPAMAEGCFDFIRMGIWPTALLSATLPLILVICTTSPPLFLRLPVFARFLAGAAIGYLSLYALLFSAYYVYYGVNPLVGSDYSATITVSDPALLGAPVGLFCVWLLSRFCRHTSDTDPVYAWVFLWFLLVASVGISAFGHGWFLRLVPHRAMVFLALPLSICVALGLAEIKTRWQWFAHALLVAIIACGILSRAVMTGWFHGPLGYVENGPFHWSHSEIMRSEERPLLDSVPPGMVLSPSSQGPCIGDILTMRDGIRVVYGFGSLSISDVIMNKSGEDATVFFTDECTDEKRVEIIRRRGVDFVYCPATHPVPATVRAHLAVLPWLKLETTSGEGCVLRVDQSQL